jgi:hypothetical protein
MSEPGGLWDGRWVVCRAHTLARPDDTPDDGPAIVGIEHLPPAAQPSVAALVGISPARSTPRSPCRSRPAATPC